LITNIHPRKKRETKNKNQKKKKKKTRAKGQTLFKFAKNRNGCKRDENFFTRGNCGLFIRNIHPRKTETQNPRKLNKNLQ
jgi:hypothetical protein